MDVAIIKYNAGNIYSVDYALKRLGVTPIITADPELLNKAEVDFKAAIGNGDADMPRHAIDVHAFGGGKR